MIKFFKITRKINKYIVLLLVISITFFLPTSLGFTNNVCLAESTVTTLVDEVLPKKYKVFNHSRKLVISLIGSSASGKGTQGEKLSKLLGIPHISIGDLVREELRSDTKLGLAMKLFDLNYFPQHMPDEFFIGLLIERVSKDDCKNGFILDGFPRTKLQAEVVKNVLLRSNDIHIALYLDISEEDIRERLSNRLYCTVCGHQVRQFDINPYPGFCPKHAEKGKMIPLVNRPDDKNSEELERRLRLFRENKNNILSSLAKRDPIITIRVNNKKNPDEVFLILKNEVYSRLEKIIK